MEKSAHREYARQDANQFYIFPIILVGQENGTTILPVLLFPILPKSLSLPPHEVSTRRRSKRLSPRASPSSRKKRYPRSTANFRTSLCVWFRLSILPLVLAMCACGHVVGCVKITKGPLGYAGRGGLCQHPGDTAAARQLGQGAARRPGWSRKWPLHPRLCQIRTQETRPALFSCISPLQLTFSFCSARV